MQLQAYLCHRRISGKTMGDSRDENQKYGLMVAIITYVIWGALPIYWKQLDGMPSMTILCFRIIGAFLFTITVILIRGKWRRVFFAEAKLVFQNRKTLLAAIGASALITANWLAYIFAMENDLVMETSLGYFVLPMVNVVLAIFVLKEKLSLTGWIACGLALAGIIVITVDAKVMPWVAIGLSVSFSLYGIIKKTIPLSSYTSITFDAMLPAPFAAVWLAAIARQGPVMPDSASVNVYLILAGFITAGPLLLFAIAAKRISYIAIGFIQYIAPTVTFFIAYFMYGEPLSPMKLAGFILIWAGILVYSSGMLKHRTARELP